MCLFVVLCALRKPRYLTECAKYNTVETPTKQQFEYFLVCSAIACIFSNCWNQNIKKKNNKEKRSKPPKQCSHNFEEITQNYWDSFNCNSTVINDNNKILSSKQKQKIEKQFNLSDIMASMAFTCKNKNIQRRRRR